MFENYPDLRDIQKELKKNYREKSEEQFIQDLSEDLYHYKVMLYLQEANLKHSNFYQDFIKKHPHSHPGYCHTYTVYNRMKANIEEAKKAIEKEEYVKAKELLEEDLI